LPAYDRHVLSELLMEISDDIRESSDVSSQYSGAKSGSNGSRMFL
jgi:hypothetical protein